MTGVSVYKRTQEKQSSGLLVVQIALIYYKNCVQSLNIVTNWSEQWLKVIGEFLIGFLVF